MAGWSRYRSRPRPLTTPLTADRHSLFSPSLSCLHGIHSGNLVRGIKSISAPQGVCVQGRKAQGRGGGVLPRMHILNRAPAGLRANAAAVPGRALSSCVCGSAALFPLPVFRESHPFALASSPSCFWPPTRTPYINALIACLLGAAAAAAAASAHSCTRRARGGTCVTYLPQRVGEGRKKRRLFPHPPSPNRSPQSLF